MCISYFIDLKWSNIGLSIKTLHVYIATMDSVEIIKLTTKCVRLISQ